MTTAIVKFGKISKKPFFASKVWGIFGIMFGIFGIMFFYFTQNKEAGWQVGASEGASEY